jgi:hypothetical protein
MFWKEVQTPTPLFAKKRLDRVDNKGKCDRDNGGVILNISEGGLCFKSAAPVQRTEMIHFWFLYGSQRIGGNTGKDEAHTRDATGFIETESELAWTDDARNGRVKIHESASGSQQTNLRLDRPGFASQDQREVRSLDSVTT